MVFADDLSIRIDEQARWNAHHAVLFGDGAVLDLGGVKDVVAKNLGSTNPLNQVRATIKALLSLRNVPEDERASLSAKAREDRFRLALRVNKNGMVKISTTERDEIKKVIGKGFVHDLLVTETCNMLLEGKKVEAEPEDESKE